MDDEGNKGFWAIVARFRLLVTTVGSVFSLVVAYLAIAGALSLWPFGGDSEPEGVDREPTPTAVAIPTRVEPSPEDGLPDLVVALESCQLMLGQFPNQDNLAVRFFVRNQAPTELRSFLGVQVQLEDEFQRTLGQPKSVPASDVEANRLVVINASGAFDFTYGGDHQWVINADFTNWIEESDELNNKLIISVPVPDTRPSQDRNLDCRPVSQ